MNRSITATHRYRWNLPITGETTGDDIYRRRAETALQAITDDVNAMTVVIAYPAGLRFRPDDEYPTRILLSALSTNPAAALVASEPCDPWPSASLYV